MRKLLIGFLAIVVATGLAACGGDDDDGGTVGPAGGGNGAASTVTVKASGFAFDPTTASAKAGEVTFEVSNDDTTNHTFTIDDTDVDIKLDPKGSGTAKATLEAGTYQWHCSIHSSMKGTLTVS
jgi:cytochrome c oxidase subunit 2